MASIIRRKYKMRMPDGRTVVKACDHYTIQYRDAAGKIKRVKGYTDKAATRQLAAKLEAALAGGEQGLVDPLKVHKARPVREHIAEYVADLRAAGRDAMYVYNMEHRLTILAAGCGWASLSDIEPNSFIRWREAQRASAFKQKGRLSQKVSASTLNQYLDTARAFLNWCAAARRVEGVPVRGRMVALALANVAKVGGEKVRKRRALSDEQVAKILSVAAEERRLVYRFGLATGLRRSELKAIVWGDLRLNAIRPCIQLRAEATKARRGDRLDLPQSLAEALRRDRPAAAKEADYVFLAVPSIDVWKADLAAAGIEYKDEMGRQADFHAGTRKTLCSRMHRANVPLAVAMRRMRHTDAKLTMVDYTDEEAIGMEAGVLPELTPLLSQYPQSH